MNTLKIIWKALEIPSELVFALLVAYQIYKLTHDWLIAVGAFSLLIAVYRIHRNTEARH